MKDVKNIVINCDGNNIHTLESFVDSICDEYNVYNNFFGNILMALVSVHDQCQKNKDKDSKFSLNFYTNSRGLNFEIDLKNNSMIKEAETVLLNRDLLYDDEKYNWLFIINRLADEIQVVDGKFIISFEISSINQELSSFRSQTLKAYFKGETIKDNIQYR